MVLILLTHTKNNKYMDAIVANASMIDKAAGLIKQHVNARLVGAHDVFEKSFDYTFDKLLLA